MPDVAVTEVVHALFLQDRLLHSIEDGRPYVDRLYRIIDADLVQIVHASKALVMEAYEIASRNEGAVYDSLFVALALRLGLQLKTRDQSQAKLMEEERARANGRLGGGIG